MVGGQGVAIFEDIIFFFLKWQFGEFVIRHSYELHSLTVGQPKESIIIMAHGLFKLKETYIIVTVLHKL